MAGGPKLPAADRGAPYTRRSSLSGGSDQPDRPVRAKPGCRNPYPPRLPATARMLADGLVNVYTRDIDAAIRFYGDLLGLRETFRTPKTGSPTHVEFRAGGFTLGLGTVEAARRVHGVDARPGTPAMALVFWTEDVDREFERLRAAGTVVIQPPHDTGNHNRAALFRDPDGSLVEIVSKRT